MSSEAQQIAAMWGDFEEDVAQLPRVLPKLTAEEAATQTCLQCKGTTFETPGLRNWGTR